MVSVRVSGVFSRPQRAKFFFHIKKNSEGPSTTLNVLFCPSERMSVSPNLVTVWLNESPREEKVHVISCGDKSKLDYVRNPTFTSLTRFWLLTRPRRKTRVYFHWKTTKGSSCTRREITELHLLYQSVCQSFVAREYRPNFTCCSVMPLAAYSIHWLGFPERHAVILVFSVA